MPPERRFLAQIVSGELDVDKMDYLLRDSLFCGVRYGVYDLDRLIDTLLPIVDPETGEIGLGVEEGGVHAVEALILARYYMFTQVYFNVTGKALEHHLTEWLRADRHATGAPTRSASSPRTTTRCSPRMRARRTRPRARGGRPRATSRSPSRRASTPPARSARRSRRRCPGSSSATAGRAARRALGQGPAPARPSRVLVAYPDGRLEPLERASQFLRHLARIDRSRIYALPEIRAEVAARLRERFPPDR